ncbi:MAG: hypothetical protein AAF806_21320 [Bacteroidota bacterium]
MMNTLLFNVVFLLIGIYALSVILGSFFSSNKEENFASTLRRGFSILFFLVTAAAVIFVLLANPETVELLADMVKDFLSL